MSGGEIYREDIRLGVFPCDLINLHRIFGKTWDPKNVKKNVRKIMFEIAKGMTFPLCTSLHLSSKSGMRSDEIVDYWILQYWSPRSVPKHLEDDNPGVSSCLLCKDSCDSPNSRVVFLLMVTVSGNIASNTVPTSGNFHFNGTLCIYIYIYIHIHIKDIYICIYIYIHAAMYKHYVCIVVCVCGVCTYTALQSLPDKGWNVSFH